MECQMLGRPADGCRTIKIGNYEQCYFVWECCWGEWHGMGMVCGVNNDLLVDISQFCVATLWGCGNVYISNTFADILSLNLCVYNAHGYTSYVYRMAKMYV